MEVLDTGLEKSSVSFFRVLLVLTFLAGLLLTGSLFALLVPALREDALSTSAQGTALALIGGLLPLWLLVGFVTGLIALISVHLKRKSARDGQKLLLSTIVGLGTYNVILSAFIVGAFVVLLLWVGWNVPI